MAGTWINAAADRINSDSAAGRLTPEEIIRELEGEGPKDPSLLPGSFPELRMLPGKARVYLYNHQIMNENYARILFHSLEQDFAGMIMETVEKESRLYPRTTAAARFLEGPFGIPEEALPVIMGSLLEDGNSGLAECRASNGAVHLFSLKHLGRPQAEYLAEWEEVGRFEAQ